MAKVHIASAVQCVLLWEHAVLSTHSAPSNWEPFSVNIITWETLLWDTFQFQHWKLMALIFFSIQFLIKGKDTNKFGNTAMQFMKVKFHYPVLHFIFIAQRRNNS